MANLSGPETHTDVRRAAAVAADYYALRGLGGVATGVGLAVIAVGPPVLGVILLFGGVAWAEAWYRRRFGRVRGRDGLLPAVLTVVAALVVFGIGLQVDKAFGAPVLVIPLSAALVAAVSLRLAYPHVGVTRAHWVVVALLGLCSLLPLLGVPTTSAYTADLLVLAGASVAVGLIDHRRLMSAMKPIPHE